jgi:hypothetical protein
VAAAEALSVAGPENGTLGLRVIRVLGRAPVVGDRALLERLVANLVENAVRHNLQGGWVEVGSGITGSAHCRRPSPGRRRPRGHRRAPQGAPVMATAASGAPQ